jgi:quinol monooxygenase YgiN
MSEGEEAGFTVIAEWRIRPGCKSLVLSLLDRLELATRREPGCVSFHASVSRDDPLRLTLVERYVDEHAYRAHRGTPHYRTVVLGQIVQLLDDRRVSGHVPVPV